MQFSGYPTGDPFVDDVHESAQDRPTSPPAYDITPADTRRPLATDKIT